MKKILLGLMVFSLIFAASGFVLAQELERIPSPDQIKNFKMIKKEGNALFGVRLKASSSPVRATSSTKIMEKILHPNEISLFEKIKQIGNSLWGIRKGDNDKPKEVGPIFISPEAAQCVKNAIDVKDAAVKTAIASSSQSLSSAIDARNVCQKAAIDKTSGREQVEANKICIKNFQTSSKEINEMTKKARDEAWKNYRTSLKACSELQKNSNASSTIGAASARPNLEIMLNDGDENN